MSNDSSSAGIASGQAKELLIQVEAMVAAGPHNKLDEYLSVVDLLLSIRRLFSESRNREGVARATKLLLTAMDDLEYEFKEILRRRSLQAASKYTGDMLKKLFREQFLEAAASSAIASAAAPSFSSTEGEGTRSRSNSGTGREEGWEDDGASTTSGNRHRPSSSSAAAAGPSDPEQEEGSFQIPDILPESTTRWLNQTARRMADAGAASKCVEAYKSVRLEAFHSAVEQVELPPALRLEEAEDMKWEEREVLAKLWVQNLYILVRLVIGMERQCCYRVLEGLLPSSFHALSSPRSPNESSHQRRHHDPPPAQSLPPTRPLRHVCMAELLEESHVGAKMAALFGDLHVLVAKRMPEQLFVLLDMYAVVEEVMPELDESFGILGFKDLWKEASGLPRVIARSVANTFDQFNEMLADVPPPPESSSPKSSRGVGMRLMPWRHTSHSSDSSAMSAPSSDLVPPGGGVDVITSYVANYIKSYMQRTGSRLYTQTMASLFAELEGDVLDKQGQRSVERETARLVASLWKNLQARALLYSDETVQELYLLNNANYLVKAMSQWHGWLSKGLFRALSSARRDGAKDLLLTISDLQDDRLVQHHLTAFLNLGLRPLLQVLHDSPGPLEGSGIFSKQGSLRGFSFHDAARERGAVKSELSRLKRFNMALDELAEKQQTWLISDLDLRSRIRSKMASSLKEKYRKMLLPHWDDLTSSRFYLHSPESLEVMILETFLGASSGEK